MTVRITLNARLTKLMHEHGSSVGRRHSGSSSSNTSGSPHSSGTKLDPEGGAGRAASRRQAPRGVSSSGGGGGGGRSGRGSPLASSSHHNQHSAAAASAVVQSALDAAAVADRLGARATASAAAAVHLPETRPPQRAARSRLAQMKDAVKPVVEFLQMLAKNARDPVAVGDAVLWLVLLPLEVMRRTSRSPGAMALLRVTLEATAELLVAAMLAGAAICMTALHVMMEGKDADGGDNKATEPDLCLPPCCQSVPPEPPRPVDAGGERCSPRSVLSTPLPLH